MSIAELLRYGANFLGYAGIEEAEARAMCRLLAAYVLNRQPRELPLCLRDEMGTEQCRRYDELLCELSEGTPLQYLLGETEFMALKFRCTPAALIPRMDSEVVAERAMLLLQKGQHGKHPRIADVCCGCGTYGLTLAHYLPAVQVLCCDLSLEALALAQENAVALGVSQRVEFACGDLLLPLQQRVEQGQPLWDMIVSNPPYVATAEIAALDVRVQNEPHLALDGGADGLDFYRRLADGAAELLNEGGLLVLEYGDEQREAVDALCRAAGLLPLEQIVDYGGRDRGAVFVRPAAAAW